MIRHLDEDTAQAGIKDAKPGDTLLLEPGDYNYNLDVVGKTDVRIRGIADAVYTEGLKIAYCTDVSVSGITSISEERWPLAIVRCKRIEADIVTVAEPWWPASRPEFNNSKVVDIAYVEGLDLTGAAIGMGRKTLGIYRSSYVRVHHFYARYEGYLRSGVPYTGKCLAPSYHNHHVTLTDILAEAGDDASHTCDLLSSDKADASWKHIYMDRVMLVAKLCGVTNRYGFGWLPNDDSSGVIVRNLTLDIATGNAINTQGEVLEMPNEMDVVDVIGKQRVFYNEAAWRISRGKALRPRLSRNLKQRIEFATDRSGWPTRVLV